MKKIFTGVLVTVLIATLCLLLLICLLLFYEDPYDDQVYDFYQDNCNKRFNVIELDPGYGNKALYYINEHYGVWSNSNGTYLFTFQYIPYTQGGGDLRILVITQQSYYEAIVQQGNSHGSFYDEKFVFSGSCEFSDNNTVATISPDNIYVNEMFIDPEHTVVMTKTSIPEENIVPFEIALDDMNFVLDTYIDFVSDRTGRKFSCELANLWVDGSTMIGEWNTNGSVIPIRMELHEKVPYVEIYDVSESSEKLILTSYAKVVDDSTIELVSPKGDIFYTAPSTPATITKTN